jgi:hypothetical protein
MVTSQPSTSKAPARKPLAPASRSAARPSTSTLDSATTRRPAIVDDADADPLSDQQSGQAVTADGDALPVDIAYAMQVRADAIAAHNAWCSAQIAKGWAVGAKFDSAQMIDPRLVDYDLLPDEHLAPEPVASR